MPEGMNVEVAHKLSEQEMPGAHHRRRHERLEAVEVAILAVVAVATAWSGLQAAKWDGRQSLLYGKASSDRFQADAASTLAGLQLSADAAMFTGWLQARAAGDTQLQAIYVRRFTPDYRDAYEAWLKTDPFVNPAAPPGPAPKPSYHNPKHSGQGKPAQRPRRGNLRRGQRRAGGRRPVCAGHRPVRLGPVPGGDRPTIQGAPSTGRDRSDRLRRVDLRGHLARPTAETVAR
jgi:hypothetical protein